MNPRVPLRPEQMRPFVGFRPEVSAADRKFAQAVIEAVAHKHSVTVADLRGRSRLPEHVRARGEAMWRLAQAQFGSCDIGKMLDGRARHTVAHGIKRHKRRVGLA